MDLSRRYALIVTLTVQLCEAIDDGVEYGEQDAELELRNGTPRFYIMKIPRRGLCFDRITYHSHVTQCLGNC